MSDTDLAIDPVDQLPDLETKFVELVAEVEERLSDIETRLAEIEARPPAEQEIVNHVTQQAAAVARTIQVGPKDALAIKIGIENMGDGLPPWIPGPRELEHVHTAVQQLFPETPVIVTHFGVDYEIIKDVETADAIKVESIPTTDD